MVVVSTVVVTGVSSSRACGRSGSTGRRSGNRGARRGSNVSVVAAVVVVIAVVAVVSSVIAVVSSIVSSVVSSILASSNGSRVDAIIEGSVLSNGYHDGSMVGRRVHGAETVDTRRKTGCNIDTQYTIDGRCVDALEKGKDSWVRRLSVLERVDLLDGDVTMSNDIVSLQLLRRAIVVLLGVDKVTGDHVLNVHGESELCIGWESAKVLGVADLGGDHVARRDNVSNRYTIAATLFELLTIRKSLSVTKVDVVVRGREGSGLLVNRRIFDHYQCMQYR